MSEHDLIELCRSITVNEVSWFAQVITINFAMIVGIYYFLHRAPLAMKLFAFVAYTIGTFLYLGEMLLETSVKVTAMQQLAALPVKSVVTQDYLGISVSWVGILTRVLFNGSFWILWFGVIYLLFFWRRGEES